MPPLCSCCGPSSTVPGDKDVQMEARLYEPAGGESLAVWSIPPAVGRTGVEPETTILLASFAQDPDGDMRRLSASDDSAAADYGDDRMLCRSGEHVR
jgi:hypothetical protein